MNGKNIFHIFFSMTFTVGIKIYTIPLYKTIYPLHG